MMKTFAMNVAASWQASNCCSSSAALAKGRTESPFFELFSLSRPTKSCCVGQKTVPTKYAEMMRCFCHKTPFFALQMMTSLELRISAQDLPIFDGLIYWVIIFNQLYFPYIADHEVDGVIEPRAFQMYTGNRMVSEELSYSVSEKLSLWATGLWVELSWVELSWVGLR